jgi:hypothetical protein
MYYDLNIKIIIQQKQYIESSVNEWVDSNLFATSPDNSRSTYYIAFPPIVLEAGLSQTCDSVPTKFSAN